MLKFFKPRKKLLDAPIRDNAWLAVDVETTGLDPPKISCFPSVGLPSKAATSCWKSRVTFSFAQSARR